MTVVNENEYLFLDGSVVKPIAYQENGNYFFEVQFPQNYWNSDVETGLLQKEAQKWVVETACIHYNLKQEEYFVSAYLWEERLNIALTLIPMEQVPDYVKSKPANYWHDFEWGMALTLIPMEQVPDYVKANPINYWYDFNREVWTKIN